MILSILIPTTSDRESYFADIMSQLCKQVATLSEQTGEDYWRHVEILKDPRGKEFTTGYKRNDLLFACTGKYFCFVDSDDDVAKNFLEVCFHALKTNPDCLSLRGLMTVNGKNPELFEHSLRYQKWETVEGEIKYLRYPNHLNVMRSDIGKQFKFPDQTWGEDKAWSDLVHESKLLQKEVYINQILYYYKKVQ